MCRIALLLCVVLNLSARSCRVRNTVIMFNLFQKAQEHPPKKPHYMILITWIFPNSVAFLFKHKSTCPELQHRITVTRDLGAHCDMPVNQEPCNSWEFRYVTYLEGQSSSFGSSSFGVFLMGEKSAWRSVLVAQEERWQGLCLSEAAMQLNRGGTAAALNR